MEMQEKQQAILFLEIFVVMAILGVLFAMALPHIGNLFNQGKTEAFETELHNIQTAVMEMLLDSATSTLEPVGPTADLTEVRTTDSPPLVLADYMLGLRDGVVRSGSQYIFATDGMVRQLLP